MTVKMHFQNKAVSSKKTQQKKKKMSFLWSQHSKLEILVVLSIQNIMYNVQTKTADTGNEKMTEKNLDKK